MDILQQRDKVDYDGELRNIISKLKFNNKPIEFKGSSALKSQRYYSDIDLFSNVEGEISDIQIYNELMDILNKIEKFENVYIMEIKIQNNKDEKFKYFNIYDLTEEKFLKDIKDRNFIKIDLITFINNKFMELSIIYQFTPSKMNQREYIKGLKEDIAELLKEGNYYKALKRYFNIFKLKEDTDKLLTLNEIFNSYYGEIYQKYSNLEAIQKLLSQFKDKLTKKRAKINLKDIGESTNLKNVNKSKKYYFKTLNDHIKPLYDEIIR